MDLTARTFLFLLCVFTAAAEGFNGGGIHKRLQLFKNAMHPVRTYTFPVREKQHGCHPPCHDHHGHDHHGYHGYVHHEHHHGYDHHQTHHGNQHGQGLHHKHGHRKFARAIYQDPYYHVSPQSFYYNRKPVYHGVSQYYSQKLSPYWFSKYYYSPLMPTYNYHLKPLYYYLRNPQIVAPVAWIQPQQYHLYPINNQGSSENSLRVEYPPSNNQVNHDSIHEETDVPNVQIPAENDQSNESDDTFSVDDHLFTEETSVATTTHKIYDNFNNNGYSTSYNNADQYTPSLINLVEIDKSQTPSVWINESLENSNDDTNADHTTPQYIPSLINLVKINKSQTPSVKITETSENVNQETTTSSDRDRIYTTKSDDSFNSGVPDSLRTTTPINDIENARSTTYEPIPITDSLEHKVTIGEEPSLKEQTVTTFPPLEINHEQTTEVLPGRDQVVGLEDSLSSTTAADDNNSDGGTTIPELLRTKLDDYQTSTTRSYYDVTSTELFSDKNGVGLPNHDPIFTTTESFKNDEEFEKLQTTPTNFHEQSTTEEESSHLSNKTSTFSPEPIDRHYTTTTESPREYERLPNLQTTSQSRLEESTTVSSSFDTAAYTLTLDEEVMLFEDFIKAFMEGETAPPEIDYSSEVEKSGTGIESDEGTTVSGDDIKSFDEEPSTSDNWKTVTTSPAYISMTDSGLIPDYRGLEEEFQSGRSTVTSDYLDLEGEIQSEKSSVTPYLIETTMSTPITRALNEDKSLEKDTVLVTSSPILTNSDGDYREVQTENSKTISPTSNFTDFTITDSELIPDYNSYRGLEEEFQSEKSIVTSSYKVYDDLEGEIQSEKSSVTPYLLETTMSTPITRVLNKEKFLEKNTVPVTLSPILTNSDGDYRDVQTENSKATELTSATSLFTDFTEASGNEFPKLEVQSTTPYAGSSIFTDSTENSNVWLSGFKFESNSVETTPLSVHYVSTENYLLSTPDSLKIESPDFTTVNTDFSSDNLTDEILISIIGNTGSEDRFKSETTSTENWNMDESIEFEDEKSSASKVSEEEFLENREKISVTEAWNEKISFTTSGTTTMNTPASNTVEKEIELKDLVEEEEGYLQKIEESEKLNDLDGSITTESNVLIHGDSSYDLEKFSKDQYQSNFVTSKSDPIDDSNVFEQVESTTIHQENKMEQEKDFENIEIESIDKFYEATTPTLEIFVLPTVEVGELYSNKFNYNIQTVENSAATFQPLGDIKNSGDFVDTTEPSYAKLDTTDSSYGNSDTTEPSYAKSDTTESSYAKFDTTEPSFDVGKLLNSTNENPTTEYFHENLPGEIKNVIIDAPVPSDIQYSEVTDANLLNDTTSLLKTDKYDQSTFQPIELQTQYSSSQLNTGRDEFDKISGEELWVDEKNNADYDDLSGLESSTEANLNTKTDVSSNELEVEGEISTEANLNTKMNVISDELKVHDENYGNPNEAEESKLNELNRNQNISQEEKIYLQNTSQNDNTLLNVKNIDETTISSEAETGLNSYSSNQVTSGRVENENTFGQAHLNDTVDEHDTSKVINETQSETDDFSNSVIRVYDELEFIFPNSEIAQQNEHLNSTDTVGGKANVLEGSTPVTEVGFDSEEGTTEVSPLKQFNETFFTKNLEEGVSQSVSSAVENDTIIDEADNVESSTRSDFTEMESSGGGETEPPNSNSGDDDGPFHVDLLNINVTTHENSETKLSNKTSVIEEVTYYNIENPGDSSHRDELFVTVNDVEMNGTGLQSEGDLIDINGDDLTDNYELTRSVRYEYNPYFIISNSDLNFREPDSNYQNDHSAIPRYVVKRDVMETKERKVSGESEEEFIDDKREASPRIRRDLESSYQGEEAYSEEDYRDYSDYGTVSNASPLNLKESEEDEEEDTKNDFGPSIKELIAYRRNKQ